MKLGDKVKCAGYITASKNYYETERNFQGKDIIPFCIFHEHGKSEGINIDEPHCCDRFKFVIKYFTGIFVGTVVLNTILNAEYEEPCYGKSHYHTYTNSPKKYAIVYYANNKRRYVPLDMVTEIEKE